MIWGRTALRLGPQRNAVAESVTGSTFDRRKGISGQGHRNDHWDHPRLHVGFPVVPHRLAKAKPA